MPLIIVSILAMFILSQVAPDFALRNAELIAKIFALPMVIGVLWTISQLLSIIEDEILSKATKTKWKKVGETRDEIIYEDCANTDNAKSNHSNGTKWVRK